MCFPNPFRRSKSKPALDVTSGTESGYNLNSPLLYESCIMCKTDVDTVMIHNKWLCRPCLVKYHAFYKNSIGHSF